MTFQKLSASYHGPARPENEPCLGEAFAASGLPSIRCPSTTSQHQSVAGRQGKNRPGVEEPSGEGMGRLGRDCNAAPPSWPPATAT